MKKKPTAPKPRSKPVEPKRMAREVRGLKRELAAECREMLQTLDLIAETLEGK